MFFDLLTAGAGVIFKGDVMLYIFIGTLFGIIAGAIPGFTVTMAIILSIPFTFAMEPATGVATMISVSVGGMSGGLISAALLGIPGTPSSIATTFDAYPMAQKGEPGRALSIGIWASFFGSIISALFLMVFAPQVARFALLMGPWEYFSLIFFALTIIAGLSGASIVKGLIAGLIGLLIATIGLDPISGIIRFVPKGSLFYTGVPFLTALIGIFAISGMFRDIEGYSWQKERDNQIQQQENRVSGRLNFHIIKSLKTVLSRPINLFRSSVIGAFIGAVPGAGASISNILAYDQAKKWSKHPQQFGSGIPDGIIASESGNNATSGGGLIPTIALGLPGGATSAVMLSALIVHGIAPGPLLIQNETAIVGGIFIAFMLAAFFMVIIQFSASRLFLKITSIPLYILTPTVIALCISGTFILNNRISDVYILAVMALLGFVLIKNQFPLTPVILGIILEPLAEVNLRRALMINNSVTPFFTRPVSLLLLIGGLASIVGALIQRRRR